MVKDHRPAPRADQRARANRHAQGEGRRARDGNAATGRVAQRFRGRDHDRGSSEIHMTGLAMEPGQPTITKPSGITSPPRTLILTFSLREKELAARFWSSLGRARVSR